MRVAWTYAAIGSLAIASAAAIVGGESAKAELRFTEAAIAAVVTADTPGWLSADATLAVPRTQ